MTTLQTEWLPITVAMYQVLRKDALETEPDLYFDKY